MERFLLAPTGRNRRVALAAILVVAALTACDDRPSVFRDPDGPPLDCTTCQHTCAPCPLGCGVASSCDPLAPGGQQGCEAGAKCTWVVLDDTPGTGCGRIACVRDGTVPLGEDCAFGPPGLETGFDDCTAGNVCADGTCADVCGFGAGANEACAAGSSCASYAGLWANAEDDPLYGACRPACDPLTQRHPDGTPCPADQGCYLVIGNTTSIAVCARAGTLGHGEPIQGQAFANSCAPGHQPRRANAIDMTMECGALCDVEDVFVTDPDDADSGARPQARPAAEVTGFAAEGGAAPFTCASHGAALPDEPTGESCRYWWAREPFDALSPFSNRIGWCFRHTAFEFDSDGDTQADAPFPRCAAISSADKVPPFGDPPHDDARYFWCKALPSMLRTSIRRTQQAHAAPALDRLAPSRAR